MVKGERRIRLACFLTLLCVFSVSARQPADFHIGDTADTDITTPVAFDVIDADATAERKAAEALKTPAIFRSFPDSATNIIAGKFLAAFAATRTDFLAAFKKSPPTSSLDGVAIDPSALANFTATFNRNSRTFPVSADLALLWAQGGDDSAIQNNWLNSLLQMMHRPVRPDDLPNGFTIGDTLRLVPVGDVSEKLSLADVEQHGKLITESSLTTLSRLQLLFRRGFPDNQQTLARALQNFLQLNCVADASLTQQARERDVSRLVVVDHYDAGQVVVRRGVTIDVKIKIALDALDEKLAPERLNSQIAAERERAQQQIQREHDAAELANRQARQERETVFNLQNQTLKNRERNEWIAVALAGAALFFAGVIFFTRRNAGARRQNPLLPARVEDPDVLRSDFSPQLAQVIKEALVQELAAQRTELLKAQHSAAAEIATLVRRLDDAQAPMHERLRTYEQQIQKLEKELAVRTEENRELLKIKIEMMRQQLEVERKRVDFN